VGLKGAHHWIKEALIALCDDVSALALPMLEVLEALGAGPLPGGGPCVVVDVVDATTRVSAQLPTSGQWLRPLPRRRPRIVVHIISAQRIFD